MPAHYYAKAKPQIDPVQHIERAEAFRNTGADIKHGRNSTQSNKIEDAITLPPLRDPPRPGKLLCGWNLRALPLERERQPLRL